MMNARMIEEGEGTRAARAAKRRYWRSAGLGLVAAVGIGVVMTLGTTAPGHMAPAAAIAAASAMAIIFPLSIYANNRLTDEVDQQDMLRANSFGLYFYMMVYIIWMVLASGGLIAPPDGLVIFVATGLATLARYGLTKLGK